MNLSEDEIRNIYNIWETSVSRVLDELKKRGIKLKEKPYFMESLTRNLELPLICKKHLYRYLCKKIIKQGRKIEELTINDLLKLEEIEGISVMSRNNVKLSIEQVKKLYGVYKLQRVSQKRKSLMETLKKFNISIEEAIELLIRTDSSIDRE